MKNMIIGLVCMFYGLYRIITARSVFGLIIWILGLANYILGVKTQWKYR